MCFCSVQCPNVNTWCPNLVAHVFGRRRISQYPGFWQGGSPDRYKSRCPKGRTAVGNQVLFQVTPVKVR